MVRSAEAPIHTEQIQSSFFVQCTCSLLTKKHLYEQWFMFVLQARYIATVKQPEVLCVLFS